MLAEYHIFPFLHPHRFCRNFYNRPEAFHVQIQDPLGVSPVPCPTPRVAVRRALFGIHPDILPHRGVREAGDAVKSEPYK